MMSRNYKEDIAKTVITLTVLHPVDVDLTSLELEDVVNSINDGHLIGDCVFGESQFINDHDVHAVLVSIGNDGTFFEEGEAEDE